MAEVLINLKSEDHEIRISFKCDFAHEHDGINNVRSTQYGYFKITTGTCLYEIYKYGEIARILDLCEIY